MKKIKLCLIVIISMLLGIPMDCVKAMETNELKLQARCAIAMDANSKIVLYSKNSDQIVSMASTTKIMTALVALKYGNLNNEIEISKRAAAIGGSTVGYRAGEKIKLKELLYGLMLRSGNDAAIAISEGIAGSVENYIKLMNEYAKELGMLSTHYESPHGLDSSGHYSTAYDLALVTSAARENETFRKIVATKDTDSSLNFTRGYHNINKILWEIPEANGVKTGFTGQAGKCLVTSVNHNGRDIIIVVLNSTPRWQETKTINDYVKKNYDFVKVADKGEKVCPLQIKHSRKDATLVVPEDVVIPIKKGCDYEKKYIAPDIIPNSTENGEILGRLGVYQQGKNIYTEPLKLTIRK